MPGRATIFPAGLNPARSTPPHGVRLVRRLLAMEGPLVRLWAWPGSGANGLLRALCERLGQEVQPLALASLAGRREWAAALAEGRAGRKGWFVALAPPRVGLDELAALLLPGERLVFWAARRAGSGGPEIEGTEPREALLEEEEIGRLWSDLLGEAGDLEAVRALRTATDGWYRPLVETLLESEGRDLRSVTPARLLEVAGVRSFLRHEVLDLLSEEERRELAAWALREDRGECGSSAPGVTAQTLGLFLREKGTWRLPRLVAEALRAEAAPLVGWAAEEAASRRERRGGGSELVYSVNLFGTPAIYRRRSGDDRPVECRLRRSLQAFAYLASSPDLQANREDLVSAIWPNEGERTIDRNFHPTLSHLRRSLEGEAGEGREESAIVPILFRGGVYQLNPAVGWEIDTREFLRLGESGRRKLLSDDLEGAAGDLRAAWRLYRGPFLQGFFDLWVAERRELFQQQVLDLLRDLGDLCIRLSSLEEAMDAYRAVLAEDPLQERVQVAVMRLYAAQGRRDLVKRQYERLCALLVEELGVAPLPQTTEDYHLLMG